MEDLSGVLTRLTRLCAFDTRNPPRAIDGGGIFAYLAAELGPSFSCRTTDLGDGCVSLLAVRGTPRLLFNVHVDTVPADPGWKRDPHRLVVEGDRAIALGAADIKGAAACLVEAALRSHGDAAILFTSDEEAGSSRCINAFLAERHGFERVVVAEPTRCRAVLEHRGIATCSGEFHGVGGHASAARALADSAVHESVRWASRALAFAERAESLRYKNLSGVRFNLGILNGGLKSNMIAASAGARFGVRPLPDQDPNEVIAAITALAPHPHRVTWHAGFLAQPLPASPAGLEAAAALAADLSLSVADPVDFWTEAALFSAAGLPAIVLGPGDIAEAHTAGEWVSIDDLRTATDTYLRILGA